MLHGDDWLTYRRSLRNKNSGTLLPVVSVRFHHLTHDDVHFICEIVREFACGFGSFENFLLHGPLSENQISRASSVAGLWVVKHTFSTRALIQNKK